MTQAVTVEILSAGLTTPIGLDASSAAAAVRAGICRFRETLVSTIDRDTQVLSAIEDEVLAPLSPAVAKASARHPLRDRLVRLSTWALPEAIGELANPPPLLVALPEVAAWAPEAIAKDFPRDLSAQTGVPLALETSRVYRQGGAGALYALRDALGLLASGRHREVVVGGVDSLVDPERLGDLDRQRRLSGPSPDGLIPGEGAGFLLLRLSRPRRAGEPRPLAQVLGVGVGNEKGHRNSAESYRGDGLSEAFAGLFEAVGRTSKVSGVYAGFNGESLPAKEWSVAFVRSRPRFEDEFPIEHPADCVGDAGAALGAISLALAALNLSRRLPPAPWLVWSTGDYAPRAAALLATSSA